MPKKTNTPEIQNAQKGYVLVEVYYEYNDEYYHTTNYESGQPKGIYLSRAKAEADCKKETYKRLLGLQPSDFGSAGDVLVNRDTFWDDYCQIMGVASQSSKTLRVTTRVGYNNKTWDVVDVELKDLEKSSAASLQTRIEQAVKAKLGSYNARRVDFVQVLNKQETTSQAYGEPFNGDFYNFTLPDNLTDEQCEAILPLLNLEFYKVEEVTLHQE